MTISGLHLTSESLASPGLQQGFLIHSLERRRGLVSAAQVCLWAAQPSRSSGRTRPSRPREHTGVDGRHSHGRQRRRTQFEVEVEVEALAVAQSNCPGGRSHTATSPRLVLLGRLFMAAGDTCSWSTSKCVASVVLTSTTADERELEAFFHVEATRHRAR